MTLEPMHARSQRDRGVSMIELLIAIVILGGASIAVLTALGTTAAGAATQREIAGAQTMLATAGDLLADSRSGYLDCASHSSAQIMAAYQTVVDDTASGDGGVARVDSVEYWNGTGFGGTCRSADGHRLQRITVVETRTATSLSVVKRPDDPPTVDLGPLPDTGGYGTGGVIATLTPGLDGP